MTVLVDPRDNAPVARAPVAARLDALAGKRIALLDISKNKGSVFLDRIADRLAGQSVEVVRFVKPTFTKPAPGGLLDRLRAGHLDAVIEALAD
jgi:hypothetical protein